MSVSPPVSDYLTACLLLGFIKQKLHILRQKNNLGYKTFETLCISRTAQGRSQTKNLGGWGEYFLGQAKYPKLIFILIGCSLDQVNIKYKALNHLLLVSDDIKYTNLKFNNQVTQPP